MENFNPDKDSGLRTDFETFATETEIEQGDSSRLDALRAYFTKFRRSSAIIAVGVIGLSALVGGDTVTSQVDQSAETSSQLNPNQSPEPTTTDAEREVEVDENGFETVESEKAKFLEIYEQAKEGSFFTIEKKEWLTPEKRNTEFGIATDEERATKAFLDIFSEAHPDLDIKDATTFTVDMSKVEGSQSKDKLTLTMIGSNGDSLNIETAAALVASVNMSVTDKNSESPKPTTGDRHLALVVGGGETGNECIPGIIGALKECNIGGSRNRWALNIPSDPASEAPTALIEVSDPGGDKNDPAIFEHELAHEVVQFNEATTDSGLPDSAEDHVTDGNHPGVHEFVGSEEYTERTGKPGANTVEAILQLAQSNKIEPLLVRPGWKSVSTSTTQPQINISSESGLGADKSEITHKMQKAGAPEDHINAMREILADQQDSDEFGLAA